MRGRFWEQIRAVENKLIKEVSTHDHNDEVSSEAHEDSSCGHVSHSWRMSRDVTPHKNAVTVVPWYRKTCRSECMFVPVVDSSATEMSTRGVILLTEGSDELKSRYTLLKYNTATETSGNSRLWRHEPLRQWYTCWRKFGRWSRKPKALALGALTTVL